MYKPVFILSVDTEEDNQWKWKPPEPFTFENIYRLDGFQSFCENYQIKPTYFITDSVVCDERSVDVLSSFDKRKCEFGAHMHPWSNSPIDKELEGDFDNRKQLFPSQLPSDLFENKLQVLTDNIEQKLKVRPVSFRAGKWGFSKWMAPILERQGYMIDSSVTPTVNWRSRVTLNDRENIPNFCKETCYPYVIEGSNILEVPMTILYTGNIYGGQSFANWVGNKKRTKTARAYEKFLSKPLWLRIYKTTTKEDILKVFKKAEEMRLPIIQFMIHSSELIPGGSPYNKTLDDIERVYDLLKFIFNYTNKNKFVSHELSYCIKDNSRMQNLTSSK